MRSELKPCPKCLSDRVTCWNVTGGNQIVCKDCGLRNKPDVDETAVRNDWNTRAVPDVPELVRYGFEEKRYASDGFNEKVYFVKKPNGEYVFHSSAAAVIAAKDAEIQKLKDGGHESFKIAIGWQERALAAEAKLAQIEKQDYFAGLVEKARFAAAKAMIKFPQPNYVSLKIAEEAGEVVRGAVHYAEGRLSWDEVEGEIVQLMAMLIRFVVEGDQINGVTPPTGLSYTAPVASDADLKAQVVEYFAAQAEYDAAVKPSGGFGHPKTLKYADPIVQRVVAAYAALNPSDPNKVD